MSEAIKLVIAIPSAGLVRAEFAYSLAGMIGRISQGCPTRCESEINLTLDMQLSSVIHSNREMLVKRAIKNEATHLLFIDDDMSFDPRCLEILLGRRLPVVACNYAIKKIPMEFVAVSPEGRRIITKVDSTGLQEIAYTGFGFSLFEVDVFKKTPQPWFLSKFVPEADICYTTEDNPCFERIRASGYKCYLDHDASKLISHIGSFTWKWDQWIPKKKEESNGSDK